MTLKLSLAFNREMFLGGFCVPLNGKFKTVTLNSKFRSFLVRILI